MKGSMTIKTGDDMIVSIPNGEAKIEVVDGDINIGFRITIETKSMNVTAKCDGPLSFWKKVNRNLSFKDKQ